MEYLSYGYESILYLVLVLLVCHLVLDLLPAWYRRTRHLLTAVPVPVRVISGLLIIISFFLL